jgi:hypothetical protein
LVFLVFFFWFFFCSGDFEAASKTSAAHLIPGDARGEMYFDGIEHKRLPSRLDSA